MGVGTLALKELREALAAAKQLDLFHNPTPAVAKAKELQALTARISPENATRIRQPVSARLAKDPGHEMWPPRMRGAGTYGGHRGYFGTNVPDYQQWLMDWNWDPPMKKGEYEIMKDWGKEYPYWVPDGLEDLIQRYSIEAPRDKPMERWIRARSNEDVELVRERPQSFTLDRDFGKTWSGNLKIILDTSDGVPMLPVPITGQSEALLAPRTPLELMGEGTEKGQSYVSLRPERKRFAEGGLNEEGPEEQHPDTWLERLARLADKFDVARLGGVFNPSFEALRRQSGYSLPLGEMLGLHGAAHEVDRLSREGLPTFHLRQPEQPFLDSQTVLNNPLENGWPGAVPEPDDMDSFGSHLMDSLDASQLSMVGGPLKRIVSDFPHNIANGAREMAGASAVSAAHPLDVLKQRLQNLTGILTPRQLDRLGAMTDMHPHSMSLMSPSGLRDLATTPGKVTFMRPGEFLDWAKPMIGDSAEIQAGLGTTRKQWIDEMAKSGQLADSISAQGLNYPPALTLSIHPNGELVTSAHEGRHRALAKQILNDRAKAVNGTSEEILSPTILYRHDPTGALPKDFMNFSHLDPYQIKHRLRAYGSAMPTHDWIEGGRDMDGNLFKDPGPIDALVNESVIPQWGTAPSVLLSKDFGPYTFPRRTPVIGDLFAQGGLAQIGGA